MVCEKHPFLKKQEYLKIFKIKTNLYQRDKGFDATQLHWCAFKGKITAIRALLEVKKIHNRVSTLHFDSRDKDGNTPLMWAIWGGNLKIVQALIEAGASIKDQNLKNKNAITLAKELGQNEIHSFLAPKQSPPPTSGGLKEANQILYQLIKNKIKYSQFKKHMDKNIHLLSKITYNNYYFIHMAAFRGKIDALEFAIESGIDINQRNNKKKSQLTPLMYAAFAGKLKAVQLLLGRGADPSLKSNQGFTASDYAKNKNHLNIYEQLHPISKRNKNIQSKVIKRLLKAKDSVSLWKKFTQKNKKGIAWMASSGKLLHQLVDLGKFSKVQELLKSSPPIEFKNDQGFTPLMSAAIYGNVPITKLLIQSGANPLTQNNQNKSTYQLIKSDGTNKRIEKMIREWVSSIKTEKEPPKKPKEIKPEIVAPKENCSPLKRSQALNILVKKRINLKTINKIFKENLSEFNNNLFHSMQTLSIKNKCNIDFSSTGKAQKNLPHTRDYASWKIKARIFLREQKNKNTVEVFTPDGTSLGDAINIPICNITFKEFLLKLKSKKQLKSFKTIEVNKKMDLSIEQWRFENRYSLKRSRSKNKIESGTIYWKVPLLLNDDNEIDEEFECRALNFCTYFISYYQKTCLR